MTIEFTADHRLATYGTLAPGQINSHELEALYGVWKSGVVRADLFEEGWGADHGCPGCLLNPNGNRVEVSIFESMDLPNHWKRLDAFEGKEYCRVPTYAETDEGPIEVFIYELNREALNL